jgi:hypothetical protein
VVLEATRAGQAFGQKPRTPARADGRVPTIRATHAPAAARGRKANEGAVPLAPSEETRRRRWSRGHAQVMRRSSCGPAGAGLAWNVNNNGNTNQNNVDNNNNALCVR